MYPATNLIDFVDPVQDITVETAQVLVQRSYRGEDVPIGVIVDVKPKRYYDGFTVWYITDSGDYVQGAPVSPYLSQGTPVIGILDDGLSVWGTMGEKPYGEATPFIRINNVMRSDRQTVGGLEFSTRSCHVRQWVKAAPWAERLMPTFVDGVGSASAKLALAAQFRLKRKALAEVINQMVMRDLDEDLEELTENYSLPIPTFGAMVTASAFLPTAARLDNEALEPARAIAADGTASTIAYARMSVTFMYPGDATNREEVRAFSVNSMSRHAAKVMKSEGVCISDSTVSPAMRGLSS
jgi:hypothetical protein